MQSNDNARTICLQKFKIDSISSSSVVLILGKRATGKSVLALDVLLRGIGVGPKKGVVFAPTDKPLYDAAFAASADADADVDVHADYSLEAIQAFVERQRLSSDPAFVVFDNCMMDMKWTKEKAIKELFIGNRKLRTTIVLTMPYAAKLPFPLHSLIEYVFVLREDSTCNRRQIHDLYAGALEFSEFHQVMDQVTHAQKGECVVLNNMPESNRLQDQVFWYRASPTDA